MSDTLDLDALQKLCDAATAHYDSNRLRVARRQVVAKMPLLITEVRRLRERYTMLCAECGYIRAKHPMNYRDCSGFEESESFRD